MKKKLFKKIFRKIRKKAHVYREMLSRANMRRRGCIITLKEHNVKFYLPYFNMDLIQRHIYTTRDYYEIDNLEMISKFWGNGIIGREIERGTVIDVGANIGNHTLFFIDECKAQKVICFEPIKNTKQILERNIKINKMSDRVMVFDKAVGRTHGHAKIDHYDTQNIGGTTLAKDDNGNLEIVALDDFDFDNIKLVKIDVEGFEIEVLSGMNQLVSKNHPYIMVELRDSLLVEMKSLIKKWNYSMYAIKPFPQYGYSDYLLYPKSE